MNGGALRSYKLFCSAFVRVLFRATQPLPNKPMTSLEVEVLGSQGALPLCLGPPQRSSHPHPPPLPLIQCKQGLEKEAGNTLLMEGVWQIVKVIVALFSAAELTRLVCGQIESKRAHLSQSSQTALLVLHRTLVLCCYGGDVCEAWRRTVNMRAKSRRNLDKRPLVGGFALVTAAVS